MNLAMQRRVVVLVLRVAGVLTMFGGLILLTRGIIQWMAVGSANLPPGMNLSVSGGFGRMFMWGWLGSLAVVGWGFLLCTFSAPLAGAIVSDDAGGSPELPSE